MSRKNNPEKDLAISSAAAAAARSRRTPAPRSIRPAPVVASSATPDREPEKPAFVAEEDLSHEDIARLAYALWEARGGHGGNPEEDWRHAEEQLRQRVLAAVQ